MSLTKRAPRRGTKELRAQVLPAAVLEDLKRSGLNPMDARALRIQPQTAAELKLLTKLGSRSGYKLPYFDFSGEPTIPYYRIRFLGEASPAEGKAPRYWQPPKTAPHLYLPPFIRWQAALNDPGEDLYLVEGEKKAAAGCKLLQLPVAGLGGVWSFGSKKDQLSVLPDLLPFLKGGRRVIIVFDADPTENLNVVGARETLAQEIYRHGATPLVLTLPLLAGRKTGLDDYLLSEGPDAFLELEPEPTGYAKALSELNKELCYIQASHAIYHLPTRHLVAKPQQLTQLSYAHRTILVYDREGKPHEKNLAAEWLLWPGRRTHTELVYEPGEKTVTKAGALNVWQGWGVESRRGLVGPFIALLDHLCKGMKPDHRKWFMQWLAYPVQHPGTKLGTACLFFSRQHGTGKSLLGYMLGEVYGRNFAVLNAEALHASFNTWARHRQFILGEEVTGSERRADNERLKLLITQKKVIINEKFQPAYELADRCNYYLTTNHADALNLDKFDRRFFIHEVLSDRLPDDLAAACDPWYTTTEGASALRYYLEQVDLAGFLPLGAAPVTDAKQAMQDLADQPVDYDIRQLLASPERLELAGSPLTRDLYTPNEVAVLLDPDGRKRLTAHGVAKALRRCGLHPLPMTKLKIGTHRLYALRNQKQWQIANHAARVKDHDG